MTRITELPSLGVDALPVDAVTLISVAPAPGEDEQSYQFPIGQYNASITEAQGLKVSIAFATWVALDGVEGSVVGQSAAVYNDAGTHTDPVVGGTVDNEGIYSWSDSPAGWERIADLEAADAEAFAAEAEASATAAASSASSASDAATAAEGFAATAESAKDDVATDAAQVAAAVTTAQGYANDADNAASAADASATSASGSATAADASADAAAASQSAAASSASAASGSANDADADADAAAASAAAAAGSATTAAASASSAGNSAAAALTYRDDAQDSAANAAASAGLAIAQTTNAPSYKDPVHLIATTNQALTYGSPPVIDGVQTTTSMRVALCVQNAPAQNGYYSIGATSMTRTSDADTAAEVANSETFALLGDKFRGKVIRVITSPATLDTDPLYFAPIDSSMSNPPAKKIGTLVRVGDSNEAARIPAINAWLREMAGSGCPMELWTIYNMAQNGSQLNGWVLGTQAAASGSAPPEDYTLTNNPYIDYAQCARANPDILFFRLGINDMNTPTARAGGGAAEDFDANMDFTVNWWLWNSNALIVLSVPQPYGAIDYIQGPLNVTDWAADAPGTPEDNAAYWSQRLRAGYLRQAGRSDRVIIHDCSEIYNPGVTYDPTLHRCDNPQVNCLDPDVAKVSFLGYIASNVLTVTKVLSGGTLANGDPVAPYSTTGITGLRAISSLGTGTGGTGTYNLAAGSDVGSAGSPVVMKIPAPYLDDALHDSDASARRRVEHLERLLGMEGMRDKRSFIASMNNVSPFHNIFTSGRDSWCFEMIGRSKSGNNMLLSLIPSPEGNVLGQDPLVRLGNSRVGPVTMLSNAELSLLIGDLTALRNVCNARGNQIKMMILGGTGTIYNASAISLLQFVDSLGFYATVQVNDVDMSAEAATGTLYIWVEDSSALPFLQRQVSGTMPPGTAAVASLSIPNSYSPTSGSWPIRRVKASRFAATDGAFTIDVGLTNIGAGQYFTEIAVTKAGCFIDNGSGSAGTTVTVPNSTGLVAGQTLTGTGVSADTVLVSQIDATHWTVNNSQLVASTSINFGLNTIGPPAVPLIIGQLSFTSSGMDATYTANASNIANANAVGIGWAYPTNGTVAGFPSFKQNYRLTFVPSITITRPVNVFASE